jgi:4-hydroxy-L-threonine phosphate dehydrogenase PdxA
VFRRAVAGEFDVVIGMYHDQALIPVKLLDFDTAVNVTLGLPIIRTSVDHGTAYDIAGRGVASASSMIAAMRLGVRMAQNRSERPEDRALGEDRGHGEDRGLA